MAKAKEETAEEVTENRWGLWIAVTALVFILAYMVAPPLLWPEVECDAVISGPSECSAGDLVRISSEGSKGETFRWAVVPEKALENAAITDGGRSLAFASRTPGTYTFVLGVAVDGELCLDTHELRNGSGPDPNPPGPDPPDPLTPLADWAYRNALMIEPTARSLFAEGLSQNFSVISSQIAAGTIASPQEVIRITQERNNLTLGEQGRKAWLPWFEALRGKLNSMAKSGELTTMEQHARAWNELSLGLGRAAV